MNLTDNFLIAMPSLQDPNFHGTVTYMCAHNEDGAMGIVINRPLKIKLGEVFAQLHIDVLDDAARHAAVLQGGPVQTERGFVIHQPGGSWDSVMQVSDAIAIATSHDILHSIAQGNGPLRAVIALGYAGWGAGQLEREVLDNAWLSTPADSTIIFDVAAEHRWEQATRMLGVDPARLMGEAGHG
ncbi:MAG: putative transcriptional regulator [Gammaproteobacteria bacterium]|jgi:putative transcriptional regulator